MQLQPQLITVTIPKQPFDEGKYFGKEGQACYLREALELAGYRDVRVGDYGSTHVGTVAYEPTVHFGCDVLEKHLETEDVTVTLVKSRR
jgi:hypothetical protein